MAIGVLSTVAATARAFETTLLVKSHDSKAILRLFVGDYGKVVHYQTFSTNSVGVTRVSNSLCEGMSLLTETWHHAVPNWNVLTLTINGASVANREVLTVLIRAWCEALIMDEPQDLPGLVDYAIKSPELLRDGLLAKLRQGVDGVAEWNNLDAEHLQRAGNFQKSRLAGSFIDGANLSLNDVIGGSYVMDWSKSDFSKAHLSGACLLKCNLKQCKFVSSNLRNADLQGIDGSSAKFTGADLSGANIRSARLMKADFSESKLVNAAMEYVNLSGSKFANSNLEGADLTGSYLNAVDFTGANLTNAILKEAYYDEKTIWPVDESVPWLELKWGGRGVSPLRLKALQESLPKEELDFGQLLSTLYKEGYGDRLRKALAMLKVDRFELFADVEDEYLIGVVKSQTDKNLVYSCRLSESGEYYCCSQNLFPCGGLRGALCKHLLVLILGLAKAEKLLAKNACCWALLSSVHQPVLNKELASETFLRYKGAEVGEIDWRPTETIPEDYY